MKKKEVDILKKLKYVAFCTACMPEEKITFDDFIKFCKFQLCLKKNILLLDHIWDDYSNEDIIVEYYALLFATDLKERERFIKTLKGKLETEEEDPTAWMDAAIEENQKELLKLVDNQEESVSFKPVMGE